MRDDLDDAVQKALRDGRLVVSLEFHATTDGGKSGSVALTKADGEAVLRLPVESAEEMNVVLARLVQLGFRERTSPAPGPAWPPVLRSGARTEPTALVAGVDGYRKGWVVVSLDPSGDVQVSTHPTFAEVVALGAQVIAVDIPIDPPGLGDRATDRAARAFVGPARASTVFPTPPRAAVEAGTFTEACEIARGITGKAISQQAFALGPKILEVHEYAERDERVIEVHPEVSFRELAGGHLLESKHTPEGLDRRRALLAGAEIRLPGAVRGVPEVDLLDAAAGAWTAARYSAGKAERVPLEHSGRLGAIWR